MDRVKPGFGTLIQSAYAAIPELIHPLIRAHFLTGTDPVFAGLHCYHTTDDGRSFGDTAHVVYDIHQEHMSRSQRYVTVVLPKPNLWSGEYEPLLDVVGVVHELGHVLHDRVGLDVKVKPITRYAQNNHHEAFAEAFASWVFPEIYPLPPDAKAAALFEELAL